MNRESPYLPLFIAIMLIWVGIDNLLTGESTTVFVQFAKIPTVDWIGWVFLPIGIIIFILSILSIWRGEGKPKKYTSEEIDELYSKAESEMNAMYFKEHGKLPDKPKKEE